MYAINYKQINQKYFRIIFPFDFLYNLTGLKPQLADILGRPHIQACLHHYKDRHGKIPDGVNADVYDGKVWKEWEAKQKTENQTLFAKDSGDIALQLNVDAFQPFEKVQYSMTAVFVAILNLPMEIRYKQENIILLALLPGNYNCTVTLIYFFIFIL